jgi:hypothetical protein
MTTKVTIEAWCSFDTEVVVALQNNSVDNEDVVHILQDKESIELYVYDDRKLTVWERKRLNKTT